MVEVVNKKKVTRDKKQEQTTSVLQKMRHTSQEEEAARKALQNDLAYADLNLMPINSDEVREISEENAQKYSAGVFFKRGRKVRMAITTPENAETQQFIKQLEKEKGWNIDIFVVSQSSLDKVLDRYKSLTLLENLNQMQLQLSGEDLQSFQEKFGNLLNLKNRMSELPTTEIISTVIAGGISLDASDIHFEPQEKGVRLRYRLDGVLQDAGEFPPNIYKLVLSRIKMLGKMKLNIRTQPQDGHFSIRLDDLGEEDKEGRVDIRVSIIPSRHGETVVMRLLNQEDVLLQIEELGLRGKALQDLQQQTSRPNGMIITTGPTGSGKTTTLYSLLNKLNKPGTKIITIENPIEYEIEGISQTEVSKRDNYSFATGLRSIVRQDPDIILVGEIRDDETADIAVNAGLTGHLVLTTLHTNNAAGSVSRLIELGVKPALIPSSVNVFMAQRLVRQLCDYCKEKYVPATEIQDMFKRILSLISPKAKVNVPKSIETLYRPKGCSKCSNTGYKGRIGIFEVIVINTEIQELIENMESEHKIAQAAMENGMVTMTQDGVLKAIEGITSMEEVWRVAGQIDLLEEMYEQLMEQTLGRAVLIQDRIFETLKKSAKTKEAFAKHLNTVNPEDLAEHILAGAIAFNAGDIHIEPEEDRVEIRFRIDGILQSVGELPLNEYPVLMGKIKMLSGLKTESRSGVSDSRFSIALEKKASKDNEDKIDVRVSIILGGYGETAVLRLLDKSAVALDVDTLGIRQQNLEIIKDNMKKPNGIFLNTGPTGSGKTTTLYSMLKELNTPDVKIMTVEDPIEYQMDGILQTQVNEKEGYTFANAMRSLLRQNPDIIMIGEIRDEETAEIAVQAALTGHLVLSTLHTNNASGSIQRLLNMRIRPDDLVTASNAYMAQRLVRKLCSCKKKRRPTKKEEEIIHKVFSGISSQSRVKIPKVEHLYAPVGCEKCQGIGFKGRGVISEVLQIHAEVRQMIARGELVADIERKAIDTGMLTMPQDGVLKVVEGETTLEEVQRVTEL